MISIVNLLQITYYPVVHRLTYERIIHIVLISDQLDSALVILFAVVSSFFTVLALYLLDDRRWLIIPELITLNLSALLVMFGEYEIALALLVVGISIFVLLVVIIVKQVFALVEDLFTILCVLEFSTLINWLLYPFIAYNPFSHFSSIEAQLFYVPAELTPIAMLLLLFSLPIFSIFNRLRRRMGKSYIGVENILQPNIHIDGRILLVIAVVLTAFLTSYPYLPSINPTGKQVGTDIYFYAWWLNDMEASQAIEFALHHISSRPLFLLLLHYLKLALQMPMIPFLERMAAPIFCMLPISIYYFGLTFKDRSFAGLVALFSSFSINVVVGMYTAYYSNVLALSILYFALALLLLSFRRNSYLLAALSSILSIITIFIHPWTWAFILVAICLFVGIHILRIGLVSHGEILQTLRRLGPAILFIAINITTDLFKTLFMPVPTGVGLSYDIANARININEIYNLSYNLYFTFRIFAGGYFNNFSAIFTAIIGTWYLSQQKGSGRDIIVAWLGMGALPTLFVDFWLNERIFFNLPIQILSTIGLWLWPSTIRIKSKTLMKILLLYTLININYALRSIANLI